jgi:hypothetical protein
VFWTLLKGNPTVAAMALALFVVLNGISYHFGYVSATEQYEGALLSQQQAIVSAQHDRDVANHNSAVNEGKLIEARRNNDQKHDDDVQRKIEALPEAPACAPSDEVIDLLNDAGH